MTQRISHTTSLTAGFLATLLLCNAHLLSSQLPQALMYQHDMVLAGQWWRILTYALVHVSWYHLILDTAATIILWHEIRGFSNRAKLLLTAYLSITVLSVSVLFSPLIDSIGLCGLSGIAHGLALFAGFSQISIATRHKSNLHTLISGVVLSSTIILKCLYETWTGHVLFSTIHLGELGTAIVHAHLGGALGGASACVVTLLFNFNRKPHAHVQ